LLLWCASDEDEPPNWTLGNRVAAEAVIGRVFNAERVGDVVRC